jgi:hypothetical protein
MDYLIPVPDASQPLYNLKDCVYTRVVVHSRDRDLTLWPNQNHYEIELLKNIPYVLSAELLYADVPGTQYLVNANRNSFLVNGSPVVVASGDYDGIALAAAVQAALAVEVPSATCVYVPAADGFAFAAPTAFAISFTCDSPMNDLLGFPANASTTPATALSSAFRRNAGGSDDIVVKIANFTVNQSNDPTADDSFVILRKGTAFSPEVSARVQKFFKTPLSVLTRLRISIFDSNGRPYDCQNQDHRFELMTISSKIPMTYNPLADAEVAHFNAALAANGLRRRRGGR